MRTLALTGTALCALGVLLVAALHVVPSGADIDPARRTLSEYALHDSAWLFNLGVLALAAGSAAVTIAAAVGGLIRPGSTAGAGLILWTIGLAGVVTFPKHNWTIGPSAWGDVHRVASLVAFVSLPIAVLAMTATQRRTAAAEHPTPAKQRRTQAEPILANVGAAVALAFFGVIAGAVIQEPFTGVRWWRAIPLGMVERGLVTAEVVAVLALGAWVAKSLQTRAASLEV